MGTISIVGQIGKQDPRTETVTIADDLMLAGLGALAYVYYPQGVLVSEATAEVLDEKGNVVTEAQPRTVRKPNTAEIFTAMARDAIFSIRDKGQSYIDARAREAAEIDFRKQVPLIEIVTAE